MRDFVRETAIGVAICVGAVLLVMLWLEKADWSLAAWLIAGGTIGSIHQALRVHRRRQRP